MAARKIAKVQPLTPRQKKVYAHLCRRIRFPLVYGHLQGCYDAVNDALEELHGSKNAHPRFAVEIEQEMTGRAVKILHSLGVHSIQHLIDYEWTDLLEEMQEHQLYDLLVGLEVRKIRAKYLAPPPKKKKK